MARHSWRLMGFGGGWEVYECTRCGRSAIPSPLPFGPLWPDILHRLSLGRLGRCDRD